MSNIERQNDKVVANLIIYGDLSKLTPVEKVDYYRGYCSRLGLDPYTKPFEILRLNGKEVLYCTRSGAQQLNKLYRVSHKIVARETMTDAGVYYVICQAVLPDGRCTESIGAVNVTALKGDALANSIMKAETKAKRRATLDLLGLGVLDESELDSIPAQNREIVPLIIPNEPTGAILTPVQQPENQQVVEPVQQAENQQVRKRRGRRKSADLRADIPADTNTQQDIEASVFEQQYDNEDDIEMALGTATTIAELKTLYFANQKMVDSSKALKQLFTNAKNEIANGK